MPALCGHFSFAFYANPQDCARRLAGFVNAFFGHDLGEACDTPRLGSAGTFINVTPNVQIRMHALARSLLNIL
jgi:hypothetical protein